MCEQELSVSNFNCKTAAKDGLQSYCKNCTYKKKIAWKLARQ